MRCDSCGREFTTYDWASLDKLIKNNEIVTDKDTDPVIWVDSIICGRCMEPVAKAWQNGPKMHEYMEESMDAKTFGWKEEGI